MIYLSGVTRPEILAGIPGVGLIITPRNGNILDLSSVTWGADNGCFTAGSSFDLSRYFRFLDRMAPYRGTCLFAVAPDVVGDAVATWARSAPVLAEIRARGYPAALAAQDGIEAAVIEWDAFDVLFLGGSTAWKLSHHARDVVAIAVDRGKWVHMGRVNSHRRLATAAMWGCGSADGTFLRAAPDINLPRLRRWIDELTASPTLIYA